MNTESSFISSAEILTLVYKARISVCFWWMNGYLNGDINIHNLHTLNVHKKLTFRYSWNLHNRTLFHWSEFNILSSLSFYFFSKNIYFIWMRQVFSILFFIYKKVYLIRLGTSKPMRYVMLSGRYFFISIKVFLEYGMKSSQMAD